jgi:hypothetical protein
MIRPTKQAYLKHDLFKVKLPDGLQTRAYTADEITKVINQITYIKIGTKGMKFVWCDTDRKDAAHGWFADAGTGAFMPGNCGFGKMSAGWGNEHLTDPVPYQRLANKDHSDVQEFLKDTAETRHLNLADINAALSEREAARNSGDYKRSDEIRKELLMIGIVVNDGPSGQEIQYW